MDFKENNHHHVPDGWQIIESLTDYAIFTTDKAGIIKTWSRGAEKILLYKREEIIGNSCDDLYTPEDRAALVPALELGTSLRDGKAIDERFHVKKGGDKFWASGLVFPLFDEGGQHMGFTKLMRNISDEEQAEANLREEKTLAETMVRMHNECLVILNSNLEVVNATAAFIQFFSLDRTSIIGKQFFAIMNGGLNLAKLHALLDTTLKDQNFHSRFEIPFLDAQDSARTLLVKPRRIYQPPSLLFSLEFEDLTQNRALMAEKDVFISVASHEIRTPISVIKAYSQILERELKETKPIVKRAVGKINEQINYMSTLLSALLDTTKLTTGKLALSREVFNLCSLANDIAAGFRMTQSSHRIIIDREDDSLVYADKARTGSVITNLLSNAVKYSPNGREVLVNIEADDHQVRVSVQDFGLGIPKAERAVLFQRFGRTSSVKHTNIPGTGLGLHLSMEIIRLQGGDIGYTSEEGKGSTFYFTLPLY